MDAQELETYEYQLAQIKLGLAKEPTNTEYLTLKEELESLIALIKESLGAQAPAPAPAAASPAPAAVKPSTSASSSTARPAAPSASTSRPASAQPKHDFKSGDDCSARYEGDGKWYPARITSISGSSDQPVYTVVFRGYDTPEIVSAKDVRPPSKWDAATTAGGSAVGEKRKLGEPTQEDLEKERKKKKNEKKAETQKMKAQEQNAKQKGWQAFAKKSAKKGVSIPGLQGESMFRSPDDNNPNAKVGVVGSGRGMTKVQERKRQTFREGDDDRV
ncbi:hypothetical protein JCM21900_002855 [Sporobolomyces salmonicolor]